MSRRMLLVHDEPELSHALKETLEPLGIEVDVAIDPGDAVERLLARVPDLVCVNLDLPRDSGYELCELIRGDESLDRLPIVVMSDRSSPEDVAYAEEAGADVFIRLGSPSRSLSTLVSKLAPMLEGRPPESGRALFKLRLPGP